MASLADTYRREHGRPGWDPEGEFLGGLRPGRAFRDHNGKPHKVVHQGPGSVTVVRDGRPRSIAGRTFTAKETITLARGSVVYTNRSRS